MKRKMIILGSIISLGAIFLGLKYFYNSYVSWRWWDKANAVKVNLYSIVSGDSIKVITDKNEEITVKLCGVYEDNPKAKLILKNILEQNNLDQLILMPVKYKLDSEKPKQLIGEIFRVNQGQEINLSLELLISSDDVSYSRSELEGIFYESDPNPRVIKSYRKGNGICPNRQRIKKLYGYSLWYSATIKKS
jgi:hypothetical protein